MIYLYIKTHNLTKLKYFGKTTRNPYHYNGSGKYWKRHLRKHGYDISTEIIRAFLSEEECKFFALNFSIQNNIANSKEWANLINENGLDGAPEGNIVSTLTKKKISKSLLGKSYPKTKYVIKESRKDRSERCSKSSKGTFWINNGIQNKRVKNLIEGWTYVGCKR